ncbi:acyl-CoA/acyl-ACP dehydrogenase [Rhodoplanes sp. TEM]|uniref:Acyl-CoA/acyl-ACP dehydrogenase n=1 Tax=Rhodoplanes tepidamans TaxID=200616 RepID=A0ABT5J901_RHOTP|nr:MULTISPECIES: acyl-CoA dehydrogenase family protein [Rhodoplanes]MDC7785947.1 acyl-CoA/acyl-ACP dehydrogenase [Rhodoplanes tepidamans]MDC7986241.1 acyl-CoA/acyl-ACP dehydrogenase [Rhodoplanes sp. TEM]MDQ0355434.1 alkylation response protein AidB-like acyl-CoA dehydrogenase [Rhodoplanes tepidamans]
MSMGVASTEIEIAAPAPPAAAPRSVAEIVAGGLAPLARAVDEDGLYPEPVMRELGAAGAYAHHTGANPAGGLIAAVADMATAGAACGSTAFCMWCQDALAWYLARSENPAPRQTWLAAVAAGRTLGGTGLSNPMKTFSRLDRLAFSGVRAPGGWRVSGRLPWVSNLGPDHLFASIFSVEDGDGRIMAVFDCATPGVSLVEVGPFLALEGTRTYAVLLRDVFVPDDAVISEDAARFVPTIRQGFVLLQFGMALGAARAAAALMRKDSRLLGDKPAAVLPLDADTIEARAEALAETAAALAAHHDDPGREAFLAVLKARLEGSWLALEATQAAVLQLGARGYMRRSEVHRRQREAQFVAIVTPSVKHILTELSRGA